MTGTPDKPKPALSVQQVLEEMPESDRLSFLAHAERRAKQEGNLQMLRALKKYRRMISPPSTTTPETD
jgi:hypothetical protein